MTRLVLVSLPLLLGADWPQHLGPTRDGHSPQSGLLRAWPKGGPKAVWQRDVGTGWAGPAVAGDRLILFHRVGDAEVVECLDPATGTGRWKSSYRTAYVDDFGFDDGPRATPLIASGRVFTLGADGDLRAWDLATGKERWARNVNKEYGVAKAFFGVGTSPVLAAGNLLVNVGGRGASVVAFNPATGKEVWKAGDDAVSYSSPVVARVGPDELAVFFTRRGLLAVTPDKGEVRHAHEFRPRAQSSVNAMTPVVSGDRVFLSTAYNTGAVLLDLKGPKVEEVWSGEDVLDAHYTTPILVKDHMYGIDGRQESRSAKLKCAEWATGKVRWSRDDFRCAGLIHADGLILAAVETGELVLIETSADRYKELARSKVLDEPVRALPALAGGRLFLRDGKKLIGLEVAK